VSVRTQVQKWGNSLAVRIPKAFAAEIGLEQDTPVELTLKDGTLVLRPTAHAAYKLDDLVDRVSENNVHREIDYGEPAGDELW
jgi:antitoxin MazE